MKTILRILTFLVAMFMATSAIAGENLALNKKCSLRPMPNYRECTDDGDSMQLTDGETTTQYFWIQKGCVGWQNVNFAEIVVDLEKVEPIDGVAFNTAAGVAGVDWPACAFCLVSEDGQTWFQIGDLMAIDLTQNGVRENLKYNLRKIKASGFKTKGRYVKLFLLPTSTFLFLDEIEIERGDDSFLKIAYEGEPVESVEEMAEKHRIDSKIKRRYLNDIAALSQLIEEKIASIPDHSDATQTALKANLAVLLEDVKTIQPNEKFLAGIDPQTFRTIFPFDDVHANIFACQAKYWRLSGAKDVEVRNVSFWDFAVPFENIPITENDPSSIIMAQNEHRGAALTLYNTLEKSVDVTLSFDGFSSDIERNITIFDIPWTDTVQGIPVAAALLPATKIGEAAWRVTLSPGLPKQIWISIDSATVQPGDYSANIIFNAGENVSIPNRTMTLSVRNVRLPDKKTLLLGGWDYTDCGGRYNVNKTNLENFVKILQKYDINAPWADPPVMLSCAKVIGGNGEPISIELDTTNMDQWLSMWTDAREYYIFLSVPESFGPFKFDQPGFDEAVGLWAKKWADYFIAKQIDPSRVGLLIRDEPGLSHELDHSVLIAWSRAIKKGDQRFKIWEDPVYTPPTQLPDELIDVCDTLCPNRPQWLQDRKNFETVYRSAKANGVELQFYSCSGPVRLLDPYNYFRLQAWHAFAEGATASFFWAMGDGGAINCWNEYLLSRNAYCPMFIDPNESIIISAKQLEAMRESSQDFELLKILSHRINKEKAEGKNLSTTENFLNAALETVLWADGNEKISWFEKKDRTRADKLRIEILDWLSNSSKEPKLNNTH